ncbi:MAG TPA: hypothetical protein RMH99_24890, partial [Sandaracinaceae bacterium LLY-WYZ-13_1]|nr:hypothetical protein [Sandaracinaceae bacterium LLY-WYZ-13_1]
VAEAPPGSGAVARAFASAAARSLSAEPGLRAEHAAGGASGGRAWALVALRAEDEGLDALPGRVDRALRTIAHGWPALAERAVEAAAEARAWAGGSVGDLARRLALDPPTTPSPADARALLERLAQRPPVFVVRRPPGDARD